MHAAFQPPNFRDVGEALSLWLDPSPLPTGRLLRGGKFDQLAAPADLGHPRTVVNLRRGPDPAHLSGVKLIHVPAANDLENYDTSQRSVRGWLAKVLGVLAGEETAWPVYLHCTSGRDRTGIVVAATLLLLEVPRPVIVEEFLLSDGADRASIERALDGLEGAEKWLGVGMERLRRVLGG
jgi:protein-tyrosine phosphatase